MAEKNEENKEQPPQQPQSQMPMMQMTPQMMQQAAMMAAMLQQQGGNMGMFPQQQAGAFPQEAAAEVMKEEVVKEDEFGIIKPATLRETIVVQTGFEVTKDHIGPLDRLFLKRDDPSKSIGGIPSGSTTLLSGGPGTGKSRSGMEAIIIAASRDVRVGYICAEEGYFDAEGSGREDLMSRVGRMGTELLGMTYPEFKKKVEVNMVVLNPTYDLGLNWDDFTKAYNALITRYDCKFIVLDSINALDTSEKQRNLKINLAGLKTFNHKHGVTCLIIGQVDPKGIVRGGFPVVHEVDAHVHIHDVNLTQKGQQADWNVDAKMTIQVIEAMKSVTTPVYPYPGRCHVDEDGLLRFLPGDMQFRDFVLPEAEEASDEDEVVEETATA